MTPDEDKLLKVKEVAERLNISAAGVYRMIKRGDLITVRIGRNVRIDLADLERCIENLKTPDPATN